MRIFITLLGLINGCFMLIDGIHVLINGKYIGPEKPGPWVNMFELLDINVFKLGPLFVIFGILWLIWVLGRRKNKQWSSIFGIIMSIFTLWYLPFGTLFALIILIVLLKSRHKVGN